jgi:hypothetical protein
MSSSAVQDVPGAAPALVAEDALQTAELRNEQKQLSKKTKRKKDNAVKSVSIMKLFSLADSTDKVKLLHTAQYVRMCNPEPHLMQIAAHVRTFDAAHSAVALPVL